MAGSSINLETIIPSEYALPQPVSSSASILRKTQVRILPSAQVDYDPLNNSWIEFNINSPTEQLLLPESYFIFELGRKGSAAYDNSASLDIAGVHSLIKTIQVRVAGANSQIHYVQNYNRMINQVVQLSDNAVSMDSLSGLEGMGRYAEFSDVRREVYDFAFGVAPGYAHIDPYTGVVLQFDSVVAALPVQDTGTDANATGILWNAATAYLANDVVLYEGVLYMSSGSSAGDVPGTAASWSVNADQPIDPCENHDFVQGDKLILSESDLVLTVKKVGSKYFRIQGDTGSTAAATTQIGTTTIQRLVQYERSPRQTAVALYSEGGEANRQRVLFKPRTAFFAKNLPLYTIKGGITIRFELERANLAMKTGLSPSESTADMSYIIKNPRMIAMMSAPEPSIMRNTVTAWNSPSGLIYHCPNVLYREAQTDIATGNVVLNFHAGVRSARSLIVQVQCDEHSQNINSALARAVDSLSTSLRTQISTWQVQVGAHFFPMERVDIREWLTGDDDYHREAMNYISQAFMNKSQMLQHSRFQERNYDYSHSTDTLKAFKEAKSFLIYVDLSRSNSLNSALTGTDLSLVPLQLNLQRESTPSNSLGTNQNLYPGQNMVYRMFLFYDTFIRVGSNVITTLQ